MAAPTKLTLLFLILRGFWNSLLVLRKVVLTNNVHSNDLIVIGPI